MKGSLGLCLLAIGAFSGCSVDLGNLRALGGGDAGAADVARDLASDTGADQTADGNVPDVSPDVGAVADAGREVAPDIGDVVEQPDLAQADAVADAASDPARGDDASTSSDLAPDARHVPTDARDLPPLGPDLAPEVASDLKAESPDVGLAEVEDAATFDARPEVGDVAGVEDLASPGDTREVGGRPNGASCSGPEDCQSGYCIGQPARCCAGSCAGACYRTNQCSLSGACVPVAGAITCGEQHAACGLDVDDYANVREWSLQSQLRVGLEATGSDPHVLSGVPDELEGSPWIRPSRYSKSTMSNPLVTFSLSAEADVYVGIDTRISAPSWLSGWSDSGLDLSYLVYSSSEPNSTVTQRLYQARFPAGEVSLGPLGCYSTSNCSMYLTVIHFVEPPGEACR